MHPKLVIPDVFSHLFTLKYLLKKQPSFMFLRKSLKVTHNEDVVSVCSLFRSTTQRNADTHLCLEWDSNPRSQFSGGRRRYVPQIARPLGPAVIDGLRTVNKARGLIWKMLPNFFLVSIHWRTRIKSGLKRFLPSLLSTFIYWKLTSNHTQARTHTQTIWKANNLTCTSQ